MISLRALLGLFPSTIEFEGKKDQLEAEFKAIKEFEESEELKRYAVLEQYVRSKEFSDKKSELLSLKFKQTNDYQKEKEFLTLSNSKEIKMFLKTSVSEQLRMFEEIEKSDTLKKLNSLLNFIQSPDFDEVKKETSLPPKTKFSRSEVGKKYQDYIDKSVSEKIKNYYKFVQHKNYKDYIHVIESGLVQKLSMLENTILSSEFREKKGKMKSGDFKLTSEYQSFKEFTNIKKSSSYKKYSQLVHSYLKKNYDEMHGSSEIEAFEKLKFFFESDDFKTQKREIETFSFKDTPEFEKLQEYEQLKKSSDVKFYNKFLNSSEYKNYLALNGSERIKNYEKLKSYIESKEFVENKEYYTQSPKKRWKSSEPYQLLQEFEQLKDNEKIKWYFKSLQAKKFGWLRLWNETFADDFADSKLNTKKWITKYLYGEQLLKESYSLSQDKHFVTDGKNIELGNSNLKIITKREVTKGKSWHKNHGFVTREFGYTSGLINTGKSFKQLYGYFESKIKIHESDQIQNAFWMVSNTMVPHINVVKANDKIVFSNAWGNSKDLSSVKESAKKYKKSKFSGDYYIFSLEWTADHLIWRINGVEVASTRQGVPQEPMYIAFSSGLQQEVDTSLPATMEVDWVRCYQHVNYLEKN